MSPRMGLAAVVFVLLLVVAPATASAPRPLAVTLGPGSWIAVDGTSTLHAFSSRSNRIALTVTRRGDAPDPADPAALLALAGSSAVDGATLDVPVRPLLSGESGLDKNLWKALKSGEYPTIEYRMTGYDATPAASADSVRVRVDGALEVAGVERPVPLELTAARSGDGVVLEGTSTLKMSDFGVKPPRLFLGALRVGDRVIVRYHLLVIPGRAGGGPTATAGGDAGRP